MKCYFTPAAAEAEARFRRWPLAGKAGVQATREPYGYKDSSAMDDDSNDRLRAASTLKMPILNVSLLQERGYTEKSKALPNARKGFALALQKEKRIY